MHMVLERLRAVAGMKHVPAGVFSSVPMTISCSRPGRIFPPGACVQDRVSPGRSRAPVMLQWSRTGVLSGCAGTPGCIPRTARTCRLQADARQAREKGPGGQPGERL
jgi:hypothetical protein